MGWGVKDYPSPPPVQPLPICPCCGQETDTFFRDVYGNIVGCDNTGCLTAVDAWDYTAEMEE